MHEIFCCKPSEADFSDQQIARLDRTTGISSPAAAGRFWESFLSSSRLILWRLSIPAQTNYLYLTYNGQEDDVAGSDEKAVVVLGSGAYRIGSSVEFDWCGVNAVQTLRQLGYRTIVINYNPETVSTDYNESDRLYFDELSRRNHSGKSTRKRTPSAFSFRWVARLPIILRSRCISCGMRVLGTSPESIDTAEDRHKFSQLSGSARN